MGIAKEHRKDIDAIKGIAIIAVILYHIGMLPYGFLGVDAFLVINGFLIIPSLIGQIQNGEFHFIPWFSKRIFRLWPIVLAASIVCLSVGYWLMIPDSYENLAESVVASNVFANNILAAITTKNYWDVSNEFKPLMQMWYLGVIVQFYAIYPLLLFICKKCFRKHNRNEFFWVIIVGVIGIISFLLYTLYPDNFSNKFYFVQYRIWEFSIGGFIGLTIIKRRSVKPMIIYISYMALCILFIIGAKSITQVDTMTIIGMEINPLTNTIKMVFTILTAVITATALLTSVKWGGVFPWLGKMSLSLFVWHQVILAFIRYGYIEKLTWLTLILYLIATLVISFLSYKFIEQIKTGNGYVKFALFIIFLLTTGIAVLIYHNAGVVRDVPELGITLDNPYANRNTEYIDRIYKLQKPFTSSKPHVLVVGNSFARDFACIIEEYDVENNLEISYAFNFDNLDDNILTDADFLFVFGAKHNVPDEIFTKIKPTCKVYGIGTKSYGKSFGIFYSKRHSSGYFDQTIDINPIVTKLNSEWEKEWGKDNFIDIMEASCNPDGKVMIFTPEHKVISFDCSHLTQDGCKFYSNRLNLNTILK